MRKTIKTLAATAAVLCCSSAAYSAEWQPIGTLGIGGAGVARQMGAFTAYWNPAGGAFNDKTFSFMTGAEFGVRGNDALTDNVDRLSKINFSQLQSLGSNATAQAVTDAVKAIAILKDIGDRKGALSIAGGVPVGFAIKHLSFGVYGNMEGGVQPQVDSTNVLPTNATNQAVTVSTITTAFPSDPGDNGYFTHTVGSVTGQYEQLQTILTGKGLTSTQARQVIDSLEAQLAGSGLSSTLTFSSAQTVLNSLTTNPGAPAPTNTIDKNTTSVLTKGLLYFEAPIAYGHPFNLGKFGTLGVGLAIKPISGIVYQNQVLLVNNPSGNLKSGDLIKQITKNHEESNSIGVDAGLLWKKSIISVGVVGKNLNAPKFNAPSYLAPKANDPQSTQVVPGGDVKLDPMVRAGVALDPWSWLTIAADMDLTKNNSVMPNGNVKSQNIGGGVEIHPWSLLKLRGGVMKNIASVDGSTNPVIVTAGLSFLFLDLDAAAATKTFKVNNNSIPEELRVQLMAGFSF